LPIDKKNASYAVYAFCRFADNLIDNPRNRTIEEINTEIENFKYEVEMAFKYGESEHPVLSAFIFYALKYNIPKQYVYDLIDGVSMDISKDNYNNFDELYIYCYKVASVVGLMMTYILGFKDIKALEYAEQMGIAMQLTNILRDIKEDKTNKRIYLPETDLKKFNVSKEDIYNENFNENFKSLIKYYVDLAEQYYQNSYNGLPLLHKDARFSIKTAGGVYSEILNKIKLNDYNPFLGRVKVSQNQKIIIMLKCLV
jgi:phytoene synthase